MQQISPETWKAILEETHRGWLRRWLIWAAVYAIGFLILWAIGQMGKTPFYVWAIGGALVKAAWDRLRYQRILRRHTRGD